MPFHVSSREQVTPAFLREVITPLLPACRAEDAVVVPIGCDSVAVDFGTRIVRLPRDENALAALRREVEVCRRMPDFELRTPQPEVVEGDWPFSHHQKIPGQHLLSEDWARLSERQRDRVAAQLVPVFAWFHAVPVHEAEAWGFGRLEGYLLPVALHGAADTLAPALGAFTHAAADRYEKLEETPGEEIFGSFDAHGWNMAFDSQRGELVGLYDFADSGIGSRHQDLHPLNTTARDLVTRVRVQYERTTGWTLDPARIDLYTVIAELSDLAENLAGASAKGVAHHVRQLERWRRVLRP